VISGRIKGYTVAAVAAMIGAVLLIFGSVLGNGEVKKTALNAAELDRVYFEAAEKRIVSVCNSVNGVSDTEVLVAFSSGHTVEYCSDNSVRAVRYPSVAGIAVVCRGGDIPQNQKKIIDLLSAAFGISSTQISVAGK